MAKNHKWEGNVLSYAIPKGGTDGADATATIDFDKLPEAVKLAAAKFGIQTAARNATAGLFSEEPATAFKRMVGRFTSWLAGEWKAASAGGDGAERGTSMLAMAFAEAATNAGVPLTPDEAAEKISSVIVEKVEEAGLSADEEADKPAIRKIAAAIRSSFGEMSEVAPIYTRLKAEAAQKRATEAQVEADKAKAEGKTGGFAELLKK
jgi:hypothetical protein